MSTKSRRCKGVLKQEVVIAKHLLLVPWRLLKYAFVGLDVKGVYLIFWRDLMHLVGQGKRVIRGRERHGRCVMDQCK